MDAVKKQTNKKSYYYVVIVLMGLLMMFMGTQTSAGFSLLVNGLKESMGLSGTVSSSLFMVKNISAFLFVFLATKYYDKLGLRLGVTLAFGYAIIAMGVFYLAYSMKSLPVVYVGAVILGAAYAFTMILPMALLIRTWFNKNRAFAMGVASAGTGLSTYLISPRVQSIINNQGLGGAFLFLAAMFAIIGVIFFLFVRNKPSDIGLEIYGGEDYVDEKQGKKAVACTSTAKSAVLIITVLALAMGFVSPPGQQHLVVHFNSVGYDSMMVAKAYAYVGLALLIFKLVVGALSTRVPFGRLSCTFLSCYVISYGLIFFGSRMGTVAWIPIVGCIFYGIAGPICSLGYTNWIADFSTQEDYAKNVKNAQFAYQGAEIIGALLPGVVFDLTGSYGNWYGVAAVVVIFMILSVAYLYINREKILTRAAEAKN